MQLFEYLIAFQENEWKTEKESADMSENNKQRGLINLIKLR
jgi:hypothetical protein